MSPTDLPSAAAPSGAGTTEADHPGQHPHRETDVTDPDTQRASPDTADPLDQPAAGRSEPGGRWPALAIALVVLLAATTAVSTALWRQADADPTTDLRNAAVTFTTRLTTWDASEGLEATTSALREMGTGEFLTEVDDVLGGGIQETAEAVGAQSRGEVIEVFANEDGVAIVIVRQALTVAGVTDVQEQIARLELQQVDGVWKIARVELLNAPVLLEEVGS